MEMSIAFLKENNLLSPLFVLLTSLFLLFIIKQTKFLFSKNKKKLPPSPPTWPIIGNLHQIGQKPHVSITKLAQEYGPLMSLHLGRQLLVVASSPEAAKEILKTHDRFLSSRLVPSVYQQSAVLPYSLVWSDCNETWKTLRTLVRTGMFSVKAIEAHSRVREEKIGHMLDFLRRKQGQVHDIGEVVFTTLLNTLSCIIFSKDMLDLKDEHEILGGFKYSLDQVLEYGGKIDLSDFFPVFRKFDLQGIRKGGLKHAKKLSSFWKDIIKERRSHIGSSAWSSEQPKSFLDQLLEAGFSDNQINQLAMELFIAGTDTTTSTVGWVMAELLKNKEALSKVEKEVKKEINSKIVTESQLSELSYLRACVKETLRLHPTGPFLIPHRALQTCEVMNYTIPENAGIFINIWAISRDPKIWDDPLSFKPERFLGSKLDFRGQDFEFIPFGTGRRMCPGLPSALKSVELILASLIHEFDWILPNGDDATKLDMNDKFGVTLQKEKPLKLVFKLKQQSSVA